VPRLNVLFACCAALTLGPLAQAQSPVGSLDFAYDNTPIWPLSGVTLTAPDVQAPQDFGTPIIYVNAGHGAPRNSGSLSLFCTWEMDHNLRIQDELATYLEQSGLFTVVRGRLSEQRTSYGSRLETLATSGAVLMVEVHADVREGGTLWEPAPGVECVRNLGKTGFSVLFNDSATGSLLEGRTTLARAVSVGLRDAGFRPYHGSDYAGLYEGDVPGVWRDRRGLMMLRRPEIPSIIIETHNHQNPDEVARWAEPATRQVFYATVATALVHTLTSDEAVTDVSVAN
jgi:N-acetylmuramoyl-L-alanine amidase